MALKILAVSLFITYSICASAKAKIFILSLIVSDLGSPLLFIFHPLAVKFVLEYKKVWSLQSEVT
jgi:hypothetical protein